MSRFVAVVGTVNRDVVIAPDGSVRESLGGILYNAIPLAALLEGTGIRVRPLGRLGREDRAEAMDLLAPFPAIDAGTLIEDPAGTNLSRLDYSGGGERVEEVRMRVRALDDADLGAGRGALAWLVNMISGADVTVQTLARVRAGEPGRFLLDIQALARSPDTPRRPRTVEDFAAWSRLFHVVRGSEAEVSCFGGVPGDLRAAVRRILDAGAREVIATRGERGARAWIPAPEGPRETSVPAGPCERPVDPTGCGDAFLSAVCAGRVLGLDDRESLRLGAFTGSRVLGLSGLQSLVALRDLREEALDYEPAWRRAWDEGPRGSAGRPA